MKATIGAEPTRPPTQPRQPEPTRQPRDPSPRDHAGPRRAPFVLLVCSLLAGGLCALLALNTAAAADEVRQRTLSAANADTQDAVQQLQVDVADKQAPAALASAARALGLVPNPNPAFLVLGPDGSVTVMGSAARATAPAVPTPSPTPTPTSTLKVTPTATPTGTKAGTGVTSATSGQPTIPVSTLPGGPR
jgi:hypothetical protein